MIFERTFGYYVMLPLLCDISQNQGCIGILLSHHYAHYTENLVTGFVLLSRLLCFGTPVMKSHVYGQMMIDAITLRGSKEYLAIVGGAIPTLEVSGPLSNFSMNL